MDNASKILVNLDCLLDTRLGTIIYLNPDYALPILKNGYFDRNHNQFNTLSDVIDQDAYEAEWSKRSKFILMNSKRSNMVNLLRDYIQTGITTPLTPDTEKTSIVVNTYPYLLTNAERNEFLSQFRRLFNIEDVSLIHAPASALSLSYLTKTYRRFITHDLDEWVSSQREELDKGKDPTFIVSAPLVRLKNSLGIDISDDEIIKTVSNSFAPAFDLDFFTLADISISKLPIQDEIKK